MGNRDADKQWIINFYKEIQYGYSWAILIWVMMNGGCVNV